MAYAPEKKGLLLKIWGSKYANIVTIAFWFWTLLIMMCRNQYPLEFSSLDPVLTWDSWELMQADPSWHVLVYHQGEGRGPVSLLCEHAKRSCCLHSIPIFHLFPEICVLGKWWQTHLPFAEQSSGVQELLQCFLISTLPFGTAAKRLPYSYFLPLFHRVRPSDIFLFLTCFKKTSFVSLYIILPINTLLAELRYIFPFKNVFNHK
jgi:hypothetical protein